MTKYLLLRDNKQSGPYTCDELRTKGLKAYDLVWLEGRSAAWRYPSEVEELRAFAPVVEEQPFDRFYKKPSQTPATATTASQVSAGATQHSRPAAQSANAGSFPPESSSSSSVPGKRIIYVTLPAARNQPNNTNNKESATREPVKPPVNVPVPERQSSNINNQALSQSPVPSLYDKGAGLQESTTGYSTPSAAGEQQAAGSTAISPIAALGSEFLNEEDLSHSREDWRTIVESAPRRKSRRNFSRALQPLLVVVCILALLAAGIFIGLSLNKDSLGLAKKLALKKDLTAVQQLPPPPPHDKEQGQPASLSPNIAPLTSVVPTNKDSIKKETVSVLNTQHNTSPLSTWQKPPANPARERITPLPPRNPGNMHAVNTPAKDSTLITYPVVQREASRRSDLSVEKMDKDLIRSNLSNLVSLGASHYTVGAFGGISDLQLTISNRSVYALDLVVVEVQYIQANKKVFKTENLYFRSVGAGSALMQEAPKSTRGIKVQYKITLVNSKELGLSYSAL